MEEIFVILFGLVIGSFLNVVIVRLPEQRSIVRPPSHCPTCQTPIPFYLNIPVLSYLILRGRCRFCRRPISPRYPLVEAFTAFTFWLAFWQYGLSLHAAATVVFLCLLIVLALTDLDHMILPNELTLGGTGLFLVYSYFHPDILVIDALLAAAGGAGLFLGLYYFYLKVRHIEGMGLGDVKMMLLLGLFLGIRRLVVAVLLASLSGLLVGLFFIVFRKKNLKMELPFGTFLAFGSYLSLFFGEFLLLWVRGLYN